MGRQCSNWLLNPLTLIFARKSPIIKPMAETLAPSRSQTAADALAIAHQLHQRQKHLAKRVQLFQERLENTRNWRIGLAVVFFLILVFFATQPRLNIELPVVLLFIAVFTVLVVRSRRIVYHLQRLNALHAFYARQEKRCRGFVSGRPWESVAALSIVKESSSAHDLGLFGPHSLWTLLDETLTDQGETRLAQWITSQPMPTSDIRARQNLIKELRGEHWFFTRWTLHASRADFRLSSSQILKFLKEPFVAKGFPVFLGLAWLAWFISAGVLIMSAVNDTSPSSLLIALYPAVGFACLMKVGSPFLKGIGLSHHLSELEPVFKELETRVTRSESLAKLAPVVSSSGPSKEARRLGRVLAFMSIQANPILHILVNAFTPWSITATYFLERRRRKIAYTFPQCLEELAELEALGSLVIFDHYQTQSYPTLRDFTRRTPELSFTALFHPLIDRTRVVANDFHFPAGKQLGLITGSNMSGKSTFLRTVGLNQILANMGAPVFAESFVSSPLEVESCIEVSDSLRDGYSYFYAEVRRLKALLTRVRTPDTHVLFLIDEIFRGTNNRERQIGSRAIIQALAAEPQAIGFISTHDLELTNLDQSQDRLMNLHFREDFSTDGEMVFFYKLKSGPCPTTNALKIMEREGLI